MPSPTFNGVKIFDSIDQNSNSVPEGVLYVPNYTPIYQRIHFEGEIGDWTLYHGYPDMPWVFEGLISGTTLAQFNTIIQLIQTYIQNCTVGANTTYYTLVDSFGNYYDTSQVREMTFLEAPKSWYWYNSGTLTTGYVAKVRIAGIVSGNTQVGATS